MTLSGSWVEIKPGPKAPIAIALNPLVTSVPSNAVSSIAMVIDWPGCVDWTKRAWTKISKEGESEDRIKVGEEVLRVAEMVTSLWVESALIFNK